MSTSAAVEAVLCDVGAVRPAYQPIVSLSDGVVVGFEALARWPAIGVVDVEAVLAAARSRDRLIEVEWACRTAALDGALAAGLGTSTTLFVNVEPDSAGQGWPPPPEILDTLHRAAAELRVVIEVTERALLTDPSALLETVAWARRHGCGVALDDVGANPNSLALLPFVAPDVIKLDASLIRRDPSRDGARTIAAVMEHVERTGATILAEGVETDGQRERAAYYGATFGQGWLWGRPGALPEPADTSASARADDNSAAAPPAVRFLPGPAVLDRPSDVLDGTLEVLRSSRGVLAALTRMLEQSALDSESAVTVLASFADDEQFTGAVRTRFETLARMHPFVAVVGLPESSLPGVHSAPVDSGPRPWGEWALAIVGPGHAVALIARLVEGGEFEYALTRHRNVVLAVGRSLIARVLPARRRR